MPPDGTSLIARLEAASEGSRELDRAIHLVVFADFIKERGMVEDGDGWRDPQYGAIAPPQDYTTSLDAAITLVPKGWFWRVGRTSIYAGWALVHKTHPDHGEPGRNEFGWSKATGTTPVLALCIAVLKARSAAEKETDHAA